MDPEGYLPVRLISSFHRVKNITLDYGLVLTAIRQSKELELRKDMSCVRTINNPTKWPILDSVLPPPPRQPVMMVPLSSGGLIPLPKYELVNKIITENGGEMLNPNVPEFIPRLFVNPYADQGITSNDSNILKNDPNDTSTQSESSVPKDIQDDGK